MSVARCCCPKPGQPPPDYKRLETSVQCYRHELSQDLKEPVDHQAQPNAAPWLTGLMGGIGLPIPWVFPQYGYSGLSIIIKDATNDIPQGSIINDAYFTGTSLAPSHNWYHANYANSIPLRTWEAKIYAKDAPGTGLIHEFPPDVADPGLLTPVQYNENQFPPGASDPPGVDSQLFQSTSVTAAIQTLVDDPTWVAGSEMHFFWWPAGSMSTPPDPIANDSYGFFLQQTIQLELAIDYDVP